LVVPHDLCGLSGQFKASHTISRKKAFSKAHEEYEGFNKTQEIVSDFDRMIKQMMEKRDGEDE